MPSRDRTYSQQDLAGPSRSEHMRKSNLGEERPTIDLTQRSPSPKRVKYDASALRLDSTQQAISQLSQSAVFQSLMRPPNVETPTKREPQSPPPLSSLHSPPVLEHANLRAPPRTPAALRHLKPSSSLPPPPASFSLSPKLKRPSISFPVSSDAVSSVSQVNQISQPKSLPAWLPTHISKEEQTSPFLLPPPKTTPSPSRTSPVLLPVPSVPLRVPKKEPIPPSLPPPPSSPPSSTPTFSTTYASKLFSASSPVKNKSGGADATRELWDVRQQITAPKVREDAPLRKPKPIGGSEPRTNPAAARPSNGATPAERATAALQDVIDDMRKDLQHERKARRAAEEAVFDERRRRIRAEDILEDMRRECASPFVVPALMDAFVKLAQLTSDAMKTESDHV
ncbi:uncharacterized protein FIBRA_00421 [Fibroporia radiculosa]|uniref:Uncharacterized protein n=1 Tax=Fibroporia radiculosa TaxID=599839 RepID=J4GZZ0_9APHY|nr:uncharacterized protein FIBRA_00421 [Fibroporia radiculosa]CCL98424.1 predicted protein [Fibroporia radiculosa]